MDPMRSLQTIPGVGPSLAKELRSLGFQRAEELRDQDPEIMYENLMNIKGAHVDRCVLYVFRCAVYFASTEHHEPEKLKWWNWKDDTSTEKEDTVCTSAKR